VIEGMDVVRAIEGLGSRSGTPSKQVYDGERDVG